MKYEFLDQASLSRLLSAVFFELLFCFRIEDVLAGIYTTTVFTILDGKPDVSSIELFRIGPITRGSFTECPAHGFLYSLLIFGTL